MKIRMFLLCTLLATVTSSAKAQTTETTIKEGGKVSLISDLLKDSTRSSVQVQDFVLDLETGHAALQIVSWQHTDRAKPVIAVAPFSPKMDVKLATQLAHEISSTEPPTLNRQLAESLHKTFGQEVYWSKYIRRLKSAADAQFDSEKYELVPFATIKDKKIVAVDGEALGTLADVGLSDSGDIAYCVLKSSDGALRAIPLGAFLNRERNKDWTIELESKQVLQFKPFDRQHVPQVIDRGWQEYVAVRYGRDALQEVPKVDTANEPAKPERK